MFWVLVNQLLVALGMKMPSRIASTISTASTAAVIMAAMMSFRRVLLFLSLTACTKTIVQLLWYGPQVLKSRGAAALNRKVLPCKQLKSN